MIKHGGKVLGIDRDTSQINALRQEISSDNLKLVAGNFANIVAIAKKEGFEGADGVLFDFGLSYKQLADGGKGLSYKNHQEPLDMRLDESAETMATDVLRTYGADALYEVFSLNAEEFHSRDIAHAIVRVRKRRPIVRVIDLITIINKAVSRCSLKHQHGTETYARVFQALRVEVNREFTAIEEGLLGSLEILKPEGRLVVITFHSLEDRIVKQYFRQLVADEEDNDDLHISIYAALNGL